MSYFGTYNEAVQTYFLETTVRTAWEYKRDWKYFYSDYLDIGRTSVKSKVTTLVD